MKELSPSPSFNRFFIDVLEGQIITLSVVVAFILIFLIREWVVQQQPVIDLAAAEGDNALAQAGGQANQQPADRDGAQQQLVQDVHGNADNDSSPETMVNSEHEGTDTDEESSIDGTVLPRDSKSTASVVEGVDHTADNVKGINGSTSATDFSSIDSSSPPRPTAATYLPAIDHSLPPRFIGTSALNL